MDDYNIQEILDKLKAIPIPETRLFIAGKAVHQKLYEMIVKRFRDTAPLFLPSIIRNGFKYRNSYFLRSRYIDFYSLVEVINPTIRSRIIGSIKRGG